MLELLSNLFFRRIDGDADCPLISGVIGGIVVFLAAMMPERSAKKIVAMILLLLHLPVKSVAVYSGFKKSSVYSLRRAMRQLCSDFAGFVARQCVVAKGRGRKSPIAGIGKDILEHIDSTNCFALAEIQGWILDTHGIKVSRQHLSRFLKENGYRTGTGRGVSTRTRSSRSCKRPGAASTSSCLWTPPILSWGVILSGACTAKSAGSQGACQGASVTMSSAHWIT